MKKVTVVKDELIKKIVQNKTDHRAEFEEAWEAFLTKALDGIEELLGQVRNAKPGDSVKLHVSLPQPKDHTKDYDRALEMLEMEISDEVELDEAEFRQLVQDDWSWARGFAASYRSNTGKISKFDFLDE